MRPLNTPSGRPEIALMGKTRQEVIAYLTNAFLSDGMNVRSVSDYQIVGGKVTTDLLVGDLLGTRGGGFPEERVIATVADVLGGVRIVLTLQYVSNAGTAFEQVVDMRERTWLRRREERLG
jgi:hypothetical protein